MLDTGARVCQVKGGREGVKVDTGWATVDSTPVSPEETAFAKAWRVTRSGRIENVK